MMRNHQTQPVARCWFCSAEVLLSLYVLIACVTCISLCNVLTPALYLQAVLKSICQAAKAVASGRSASSSMQSFYAVLLCELLLATQPVCPASLALCITFVAYCLESYFDWEWDDDYDHHYRPDLRDWLSRCCHLSCTTLTTSQSKLLILFK